MYEIWEILLSPFMREMMAIQMMVRGRRVMDVGEGFMCAFLNSTHHVASSVMLFFPSLTSCLSCLFLHLPFIINKFPGYPRVIRWGKWCLPMLHCCFCNWELLLSPTSHAIAWHNAHTTFPFHIRWVRGGGSEGGEKNSRDGISVHYITRYTKG